jgi:hypothetical protein
MKPVHGISSEACQACDQENDQDAFAIHGLMLFTRTKEV